MTRKMLVIEDNIELRENIAEILELSGYEVVTADNGKTGVELALQQSFDVIICDIMMPQLDGYGVLHLLSKHKATRNIPFIFMTAKSEKADFRKGMEMGADDYLTKPFDGIELLTAIDIRLKKSDANLQDRQPGTGGINALIEEAGRSGAIALLSNERITHDYAKKYILYSEGQHARTLYYIISGKVKIYKTSEQGKELITEICGDGDFLGYTSILEDITYRENAEVLEDASVMMIPASEFLDLLTNDPVVARQFIRIMAQNVLDKEESLLNLAYNSLRKKVAYGIVQNMPVETDKGTDLVTLQLSRKDMARIIGVATESFIRTIADFKAEKLIDIRDGKIVVLEEDKLRNLPN